MAGRTCCRTTLVALAVFALGVAAPAAAQQRRQPATHTVTIDASSFSPAVLTIAPGDTVVWVNNDVIPHTATATARKGFDSGTIASGASWRQTFKTRGEWPYACAFHPTMKGRLVVEGGPGRISWEPRRRDPQARRAARAH